MQVSWRLELCNGDKLINRPYGNCGFAGYIKVSSTCSLTCVTDLHKSNAGKSVVVGRMSFTQHISQHEVDPMPMLRAGC
jgi:hypothetical protein